MTNYESRETETAAWPSVKTIAREFSLSMADIRAIAAEGGIHFAWNDAQRAWKVAPADARALRAHLAGLAEA